MKDVYEVFIEATSEKSCMEKKLKELLDNTIIDI